MMKSKKKSKKNNSNIVIIQEGSNEKLNEKLKLLSDEREKCYVSLLEMKRDETYSTMENGKIVATVKAIALQDEIRKIMDTSAGIINTHPIHDALLVYMKIKIIYGFVAALNREYELAINSYHDVFECLIKHDKRLKYESDASFLPQVENIISEMNFTLQGKLYKGNNTAEIIKNAQTAYCLLGKKCANTIAGLQMRFVRHVKLYSDGYQDRRTLFGLNLQYKDARKEFFFHAEKIKRALESKKTRNELTIEDQIHYLTLNFFMLDMEEMTHPRTIWKVGSVNNKEAFLIVDNFTNIELEYYFKIWMSFKEAYITPSVELIRNINSTEVNSRMELHVKYEDIMNKWLAYFHMPIMLFVITIKALITFTEYLQTLGTDFDKELDKICDFIVDMEKEKDFLVSGIAVINGSAKNCQHQFTQQSLEESQIIFRGIANLEGKIGKLKDSVLQMKQNKLKIANANAAKLIGEEELEAAARVKRVPKRFPGNRSIFDEVQPEVDESVSNDEAELDTLTLIEPELQKLESIDEQAADLARKLELKTRSLVKFIQSRSNLKVPLPYSYHVDTYSRINYVLVEYYQLIAMLDAYQFLSGKNEYPENILEGIAAGQEELKSSCKNIYENIQLALKTIDEIVALQKQSKAEFIAKVGYAEFVRIGRWKAASNQQPSEHTQQKEFLDLLQLTFSALDYLQHQIQPYIFDDCNHVIQQFGFFSRKEMHGKQVELSKGRFEGVLGLILKQRFDETGDTRYLLESHIHFQNARTAFEIDKKDDAVQSVIGYLNAIEELLAPINDKDVASMQM